MLRDPSLSQAATVFRVKIFKEKGMNTRRTQWLSAWITGISCAFVNLPAKAVENEVAPSIGSGPVSETGAPIDGAQADSASANSELSPSSQPASSQVDTISVSQPAGTDSEAADAHGQPEHRAIEEIVVTAQKREENLQDVPISISAFTSDTLAAKGVNNTIDLPKVTPGLTYSSLANYSIIYLRGVGTDAFIPSNDSSVATYIDGIYFPFAYGLAQTVGGVERIEVLKGPQGTLFGRNSTGGAISVTTKAPGDEWAGEAESGYGRFDETRNRLYAGGPITDTLGISLSGVYEYEKPYYHHVSRSLDPEISKGGRVKLRWRPTDGLDITLAEMELRTTGTGTGPGAQIHPKPLLEATGVTQPAPAYELDFDATSDAKALSVSSTSVSYMDAKWKLPVLDLRLLGSYQDAGGDTLVDFDGTNRPLVGFRQKRSFIELRSGELQLLSNDGSWGADWLNYIAGLYYLKSHAGFDHAELQVGPYDLSTFAGDSLLVSFVDTALDKIGAQLPTGLTPLSFEFRGTIATETSAAFAQANAKLLDDLTLTLGARVQKERRSVTAATFGLVGQPVLFFDKPSVQSRNVSPKVALNWKPVDTLMLYGSYAKGFKSGTYNIISIYNGPEYVKPEQVQTYELGIKSDWLGGTLRANAAVFDSTIKNIQVMVLSLTAGGAVSFENAGEGRIKGAEYDVTWQLLPHALPGLVVTTSGMYLDAIYSKYPEGSGYDLTTGLFFGPHSLDPMLTPGRDFSGNRIVQTPKWSGTTALSYTFYDFAGGPLEFAADLYYNSGFYFTAQSSPNAVQPKYHEVGAHVGYTYEPWKLRVTGYGTNLTNSKHYLYNLENDFGTLALLHPPATYGFKLDWKF